LQTLFNDSWRSWPVHIQVHVVSECLIPFAVVGLVTEENRVPIYYWICNFI
jgi:hypothetical protein